MENETKTKIEQLIKDRKEWLIESLVKFCIELVEGKQVIGEWQLCPKCLGKGFHQPDIQGTSVTELCTVCHGSKIIAKSFINHLKQ